MSGTDGEMSGRATNIDFDFCIKCQEKKIITDSGSHHTCTKRKLNFEQLRRSSIETYQNFLDHVNIRASYGNPEYLKLKTVLEGLTAAELEKNGAVWHRSCYSEVTHKQHTARDRLKHEALIQEDSSKVLTIRGKAGRPSTKRQHSSLTRGHESSVSSQSPLRRSNSKPFRRELCFYCQCEKYDEHDLHCCTSLDMGNSMMKVVNQSNNEIWKLYLGDIIAEGDFHARDIKYHKSCHTSNWRKYVQWPQEKSRSTNVSEQSVQYICAETEFFGRLQERIDGGEIIPLHDLVTSYNSLMEMYGVPDVEITRFKLEGKLLDNITSYSISPGKKNCPAVLHSKKVGCEALKDQHECNTKKEMRNLFQAAMTLRRTILKKRKEDPWKFKDSLKDSMEKSVPDELVTTILWILQGGRDVEGRARLQEVKTKSLVIAQTISQACRSDHQVKCAPKSSHQRFIDRFESPVALGMSLYMYHQFRSQKAVTVLNNCGIGVPPKRVADIKNDFVNAAMDNMKDNGVYVPPGLAKGQLVRASIDNIDMKVDTPDGKGTFHGTAMAIYQRSMPPSQQAEPVFKPKDRSEISQTSWKESVPPTVIDLFHCPIEGNPTPKTSPKYKSFRPWKYEDCLRSNTTNLWLIARHFSRSASFVVLDESKDDIDLIESNMAGAIQSVPNWSAYNSLLQETVNDRSADVNVDNIFGMPLINAPANEWKTLVTALGHLEKLNSLVDSSSKKVVVNMDMDLYKRALKLQYLHPQFKDKWHLFPGPFHIVICALRCLGRTVEGSGLEEAWREADLYGTVTINQIINGSHYNRAMSAHIITLQALFDLHFHAFLNGNPEVKNALQTSAESFADACRKGLGIQEAQQDFLIAIESLNLEKQLMDFDKTHNSDMQRWLKQYKNQVLNMLQFQQAVREGNWVLFLASLEQMCVYFFAYNRLDYAQNIPEFLARMQEMQVSDPTVWDEFCKGGFTVNTHNNTPFTRLGIDQAQEHLNKATKGQGGISGIASNPALLLKFCLTAPQLARISQETEHFLSSIKGEGGSKLKHHNLSRSKVTREEAAISKLKKVLGPLNLFEECKEENRNVMFKLVTKEIIPQQVANSILSVEEVGKEKYEKFVEDRLKGEHNLWSKMTKSKIQTWTKTAKTIKMKTGTEAVLLKASVSLFARLLIIARSGREDIDLQDVIGKYEFAGTNKRLMKADGSLHPACNKSQVLHILCEESGIAIDDNVLSSVDQNQSLKKPRCLLIDGMVVLQEVMAVGSFQTCKDMARMYVKHIDSKAKHYDQARVVFDNYTLKSSLKENTRQRRRGCGKSVRSYIVDDNTSIRDKKEFLSSNETKDSLTLYLTDVLIAQSSTENLVVVNRKDVRCNNEFPVTTPVSTQEEADTLLILHSAEVATSGFAVSIYSHDTDVLLLALRRVPQLGEDVEIITGTGRNRKMIHLKAIYEWIGEKKAKALINWHAMTGCDTTGHLFGKSKRFCFKSFMKASDEIIEAISKLGSLTEPSEDTLRSCQDFLCQLFCPKTVKILTPEKLRWHMFKHMTEKKGVENLPPTPGAWQEHLKRARCQAIIWQQDLQVNPIVPDPLLFGWTKCNGKFVPVLSDLPPAPDSVSQLLKCQCRSSKAGEFTVCTKRCSCRKHGLVCTELCRCEGESETCMNTEHIIEEEEEDTSSDTSSDSSSETDEYM